MTLNLTLLTHDYAMQVSDRVLTERTSRQQFDALTNKNVVFQARDGLVSICYAGPAYLEHVPTDTWIACKLAGEDIAPFRDGQGLWGGRPGIMLRSGPKKPWLDIGQSVQLLRQELAALNLVDRLDVMVAGWQEHKRGMRPICWGIDAKGTTTTAESPLHRYWHYERSPDGGRRYYLAEIPGDPGAWLSRSELYRLVALLMPADRSPDAALRWLIWAVRYVAGKTSAVGPDCMCILLPNPNKHPELFVRYEPVVEARAYLVKGEEVVEELPAAFTPWLVGPQIHAPPRTIGGGGVQLWLNHIRVVEQTPPMPKRTGFLLFSSTQQRPSDPSLGAN
jgi:hypothetical protein